MAGIRTVPNAAELLKGFVRDGSLEVDALKKSAIEGVEASKIALEMLKREGFKI
jgi:hypothetical protein